MATIDIRKFDTSKYMHQMREYIFSKTINIYGGRVGRILVDSIRAEIIKKNLIASGELLDSIDFTTKKLKDSVVLKMFSNAKYARAVDEGTRPHFPPINTIAKWIILKQGSIGADVEDKNIDNIAFLIARKISIKGTKATKFWQTGMRKGLKLANEKIKQTRV